MASIRRITSPLISSLLSSAIRHHVNCFTINIATEKFISFTNRLHPLLRRRRGGTRTIFCLVKWLLGAWREPSWTLTASRFASDFFFFFGRGDLLSQQRSFKSNQEEYRCCSSRIVNKITVTGSRMCSPTIAPWFIEQRFHIGCIRSVEKDRPRWGLVCSLGGELLNCYHY